MNERAPSRRLARPLVCYRIGDPAGDFPVYDARGSVLYPGRWNDADTPVIYAAEHYSAAMLEKLVQGNKRLPPNQHYVAITIPPGTTYEVVTSEGLLGWDNPEPTISRAFGATWVKQARSAILFVPSYVARIERNIVINPAHDGAAAIEVSRPEPVWWDQRLF